MVCAKTSALLSEYVDNGYLVRCANQYEVREVISCLHKLGYDNSSYVDGLLYGYEKYDPRCPNVGLDTEDNVIDCWLDEQMSHPVIKYSDIIHESQFLECDTDEDFEKNLQELLS